LDLDFNRVQFTPDLMPSDITGTEILDEESGSTRRSLRFVPGPVFTNLLLADEINRTPPKTQAALLEAMQEYVVTTGGRSIPIPQPFFVLATQNPIEQEGTYPLPEAQLDRFMFLIRMAYPQRAEEMQILRQTTTNREVTLTRQVDGATLLDVQRCVRDIPVSEHVLGYCIDLCATRGLPRPQLRSSCAPIWRTAPDRARVSISCSRLKRPPRSTAASMSAAPMCAAMPMPYSATALPAISTPPAKASMPRRSSTACCTMCPNPTVPARKPSERCG
jgi:MoxR-like ATPase